MDTSCIVVKCHKCGNQHAYTYDKRDGTGKTRLFSAGWKCILGTSWEIWTCPECGEKGERNGN